MVALCKCLNNEGYLDEEKKGQKEDGSNREGAKILNREMIGY